MEGRGDWWDGGRMIRRGGILQGVGTETCEFRIDEGQRGYVVPERGFEKWERGENNAGEAAARWARLAWESGGTIKEEMGGPVQGERMHRRERVAPGWAVKG